VNNLQGECIPKRRALLMFPPELVDPETFIYDRPVSLPRYTVISWVHWGRQSLPSPRLITLSR
jgi:hypothetical protein